MAAGALADSIIQAETSVSEVRSLLNRFDGEYGLVADHLDIPKRELFDILVGIGHLEGNEPFYIRRFTPSEAGLPPLNCGLCGEVGIEVHPCPECGFDPSHDSESGVCVWCGGALARFESSLEAWGQHYCSDCYETGKVEMPGRHTDETYKVTKWIEGDDSQILPLERSVLESVSGDEGGEA